MKKFYEKILLFSFLIVFALLPFQTYAAPTSNSNYSADIIASSGTSGYITTLGNKIEIISGQPAIGEASSANYKLQVGHAYILPATSPLLIVLAREVCGNNLGYSQGDYNRRNWNKSQNSSDPCNWYARSHIHDLNTTINQTAAIYVVFMPGYYERCVSPVLISVSPDNSNWALIGNINTSSHDTDGNPAYPQFWASRNFTMLNVTPPFRFVNISIPNCFNDWSKVIIYDTAAPLSLKPPFESIFFFAGEKIVKPIVKPPSSGSGDSGSGNTGGGSGGGGGGTSSAAQKTTNLEVKTSQATQNNNQQEATRTLASPAQKEEKTPLHSKPDNNLVAGSLATGLTALKQKPTLLKAIISIIVISIIVALAYFKKK